jgi:hypothetical protein
MNHENNQTPVVVPAIPLMEVRCFGCLRNWWAIRDAYPIEISGCEGQIGENETKKELGEQAATH